jgi:hypothetical protein
MTERFVKVEAQDGEYVTLQRVPDGWFILTTCDGVESAAVALDLEQMRRLLALFPELREAPKP